MTPLIRLAIKILTRAGYSTRQLFAVNIPPCSTRRLVFLLLLVGSNLLFASAGSFIGPGGGGAFFEPTISPLDPNRILVACDMTDGYFSETGGKHWRSFNLRGRIRFFAFAPKDPEVLYAKSIGLLEKHGCWHTWSLMDPDSREVTGIEMHGDHAGEKLITSPGRLPMQALAIAPGDPKLLFAAFGDRQSAWFAQSTDSGKTWGVAFRCHLSHLYLFLAALCIRLCGNYGQINELSFSNESTRSRADSITTARANATARPR